ncbi:hypothetical protein Gohar_026764, partial [Gossypium harknessii]|nr:hypothetical protein [Gossypium harknessii]
MSPLKNKKFVTPSDYHGWKWGEPAEVNLNNVRCKFCDNIIKGGITKLKKHLGAKKENVAPCPRVSIQARKNIAQQHQELHSEKVS